MLFLRWDNIIPIILIISGVWATKWYSVMLVTADVLVTGTVVVAGLQLVVRRD